MEKVWFVKDYISALECSNVGKRRRKIYVFNHQVFEFVSPIFHYLFTEY